MTNQQTSLVARTPMRVTGPCSMRYALNQEAGDAKVEDKGDEKKADEKKEETEQDRIDKAVQAALEKERKAVTAKADKEKADKDAEDAKKRGEWETVAAEEKSKREAAEAKAVRLEAESILREHLADEHTDYVKCVKYIAPLIDLSLSGEELEKQIKKVTSQYVKDNPRTTQAGGVPAKPPLPTRGLNNPDNKTPVPANHVSRWPMAWIPKN